LQRYSQLEVPGISPKQFLSWQHCCILHHIIQDVI